jgi:hypothetical protein
MGLPPVTVCGIGKGWGMANPWAGPGVPTPRQLRVTTQYLSEAVKVKQRTDERQSIREAHQAAQATTQEWTN